MNEVRRKVLLDIFAAPSVLLPVVGGLTAMLAAWATGGNRSLTFAGLASLLAGGGLLASRLVLRLEELTQRAYDYVVEQRRQHQKEALEKLHQRLLADQDPRTEACLQNLTALYTRLQEKVAQGKVTPAAFGIIEGVDQLFHSCIRQLKHSLDLWETAQSLTGSARQRLLQRREQTVAEVCDAVDHLVDTVERFYALQVEHNRSQLTRLRRELDESMQAARAAERRTQELTAAMEASVPSRQIE